MSNTISQQFKTKLRENNITILRDTDIILKIRSDMSLDDFQQWIGQYPADILERASAIDSSFEYHTLATKALNENWGLKAYKKALAASFTPHPIENKDYPSKLHYSLSNRQGRSAGSLIVNCMFVGSDYFKATTDFLKPHADMALLGEAKTLLDSDTIIPVWPWTKKEIENMSSDHYRSYFSNFISRFLENISKVKPSKNFEINNTDFLLHFFNYPAYQDSFEAMKNTCRDHSLTDQSDVFYWFGIKDLMSSLVELVKNQTENPKLLQPKMQEIYQATGLQIVPGSEPNDFQKSNFLKGQNYFTSFKSSSYFKSSLERNYIVLMENFELHEWLNKNHFPSFFSSAWVNNSNKHFLDDVLEHFSLNINDSDEKVLRITETLLSIPILTQTYLEWINTHPDLVENISWSPRFIDVFKKITGHDWATWVDKNNGNNILQIALSTQTIEAGFVPPPPVAIKTGKNGKPLKNQPNIFVETPNRWLFSQCQFFMAAFQSHLPVMQAHPELLFQNNKAGLSAYSHWETLFNNPDLIEKQYGLSQEGYVNILAIQPLMRSLQKQFFKLEHSKHASAIITSRKTSKRI